MVSKYGNIRDHPSIVILEMESNCSNIMDDIQL